MKKILIFALTFALAVCIAGCTNNSEATTAAKAETSASQVSNDVNGITDLQTSNIEKSSSNDEYIAPNMALKIAVAHAGVYEIFDEEVELDYERGKAIYEVNFESGKTEYEYEIDAINGDVLRFESEKDD
ncbi:MAG: PepSY domain-containing protein [Clostridia bacterium]|nr:PepSY domain-containing protein [Clostridia bacterium]